MKTLRGMKDIYADNAKKFRYFIEVASDIALKSNFEFIQTPILEETKLFKRSVGLSSDIVNKEMYNFIDKGENDVCLRPEGTASVARSFIEQKLDRQGGIHRYFYYGAMFRYERPQKGRFRQFHQFGCESFGIQSAYEDGLIVKIIADIFDKLNISYIVEINSLGCKSCMSKFKEDLQTKLNSLKNDLCSDCNTRIDTNPMRVFDCKNKDCQNTIKDMPTITDNICQVCVDDFALFQKTLTTCNIEFKINKNLVRGLDYYNKSAFEFVSSDVGAQNAIAGGGRYDGLISQLDGADTPAVGFAMGIDRILDLINIPNNRDGFYIGSMIQEAVDIVVDIGFKKQKKDKAYIQYDVKKLKNHLKIADKIGAKYCAIIGEDELSKNQIWIKDLESKEEKLIDINDF